MRRPARSFSSVFTGGDVSVSRPKLLPLERHWDLFRRYVAKPPQRILKFFLEINVGHLRELGRDHATGPTEIHVREDPLDWNPAHTLIVEDLPRSLAKKAIRNSITHYPAT
jgi:hypothetical protein